MVLVTPRKGGEAVRSARKTDRPSYSVERPSVRGGGRGASVVGRAL